MVRIKEIFKSIQGEGPYVGYKQLFVRFCKCNLNCKYCDTDFDINDAKEFSPEELAKIINDSNDCHSVSFTGGEPLLDVDFLKELLPKVNLPVYLETNGTLSKELSEIIDFVTYISSDIKLSSCTGLKPLWREHESFFEIGKKKVLFAKAVFDALGAETHVINASPDGFNINADAGSTHIDELRKFVLENKLDVGFAYDGDADRCLAVDEKGGIITGDHILYICGGAFDGIERKIAQLLVAENGVGKTAVGTKMAGWAVLCDLYDQAVHVAVGGYRNDVLKVA